MFNIRRSPKTPWEALFGDTSDHRADLTFKLLEECKKHGIKTVCIYTYHESVPSSMHWGDNNSSVITGPSNVRIGHWPAIWTIVERVGIKHPCGNSDQAQVPLDILVKGVYDIVNWKKIK